MRLLRLALESQRWDLAAHVIVLASARVLNSRQKGNKQRSEDRKNAYPSKERKGCLKG